MRRWLCIVAISLFWVLPAQATTFFDTDFELGSTACDWTANNWTDFGQAPCSGNLLITTAKAFSGTHSVIATHFTTDDTLCVTACQSIYKGMSANPPFTPTTHVFIRFAIYVPANFQISPFNTKMIRVQGDSVYPRMWISMKNGTHQTIIEAPFDHVLNVNDFTFDTGIAPSRNTWDQVEIEWLLNDCGVSNGLLNIWINGVLRKSVTNRAWRGNGAVAGGGTSNCTSPIDVIQVYNQNGVGDIYFDRIAAGDKRIGLVSGAPPPPPTDTTPPSAPTCAQIGTPCP